MPTDPRLKRIRNIANKAAAFTPTADPGDEPWYSQELAQHLEQALSDISDITYG